MAGEGGLLPEQSWDAADRPDRELFFGRPAGSAMPLVWAHAEYLKLVHSLADGCVFDMPPQTRDRYPGGLKKSSALRIWRFNQKIRSIAAGSVLRVETTAPAHVRYSTDAWKTISEATSQVTGFGVHFLDLPTASLPAGTSVIFTCYWPETDHWEGTDFTVQVVDA